MFAQPVGLMREQFLKTDNFRALLIDFVQNPVPAEFPCVDTVALGKTQLCLRTGVFDGTLGQLGNHFAESVVVHRLNITANIE